MGFLPVLIINGPLVLIKNLIHNPIKGERKGGVTTIYALRAVPPITGNPNFRSCESNHTSKVMSLLNIQTLLGRVFTA